MAKNVLVTGAAGFIGSAVATKLAGEGWSVTALDGLLDGLYPAEEKLARFAKLESIPGIQPVAMDLRTGDLSSLPDNINFVINEAAMPGLGPSWKDFDLYSGCNLQAVARLIEASASWPLEKFIQISTSSVYGRNAVGDEDQPLKPVSPYGVTKLAAENLVLAHHRDSEFPGLVLRYFSVYGPGQRPDMAYRKFISQALHGEPITLYGSGEQSRSNTYIDDVAAVTVSALTNGDAGEIFNVAGGQERSMNDAIDIIEKLSGKNLTVTRSDAARGDQIRTFGDASKAQERLGITPATTLEDGLAKQFAWQKDMGL